MPDDRVVLLDQGSSRAIGAGFGVERSMWQRQIQLAFSGRRVAGRSAAGRGRDRSHSSLQPAGVHRVDLVEQLPLLLVEVSAPLQRVVEELGRVEELLLAEDHVPVGVEPDVAHQRHDRVEDLRDAAAEGGGADVQDALALQRLGQLADLGDQLLAARCACSPRGSCGRGRLPEARGGTIYQRVAANSGTGRPWGVDHCRRGRAPL